MCVAQGAELFFQVFFSKSVLSSLANRRDLWSFSGNIMTVLE